MTTNLFVKQLGEAVNKMAEKGEVYVHKTESSHKSGMYQTVRMHLVKTPKKAMTDVRHEKRIAEKAGVPWEFEELWKDRKLEVGETEVLSEATIVHRNGDKSGRVDYITRVR